MKCKFNGCRRKKGLVEGLCHFHTGCDLQTTSANKFSLSNHASSKGVTNEDLMALINEKFDGLNVIIQQLQTENLKLSNHMYELEEHVDNLNKENSVLRSAINKRFIAHDALNQHGRHVNMRLINIPEVKKEDCTNWCKFAQESKAVADGLPGL